MASAWAAVRPIVAGCLIGATVADRYACVVAVEGASMLPTFDPDPVARTLVDKLCLRRYDFSRGDVVVFRSPQDHRDLVVKRVIALPGDWIQVPESREIRQIPEGHCWVEGDNAGASWDSRGYGPCSSGSDAGEDHTHNLAAQ
ncbi:hypothetical protein ACP4OV_029101 [Aristida adscensionis]